MNVAESPGQTASGDAEPRVTDGLYTLGIEMTGAKRGHATGVVVLLGGRIMSGDSFFVYTGSYSFSRGKWRGEMIVNQHTEAPGLNSCSAAAKSPAGSAEPIPMAPPISTAPRLSAASASPFARNWRSGSRCNPG